MTAPTVTTSWRDWVEPVGAAARTRGLAPRACLWEEVSVGAIYRMAAYLLPGMYAHWTRGRDVWRMRQRFESGLERLYEMVVNTRPARAYLLDHNNLGEHIFVLAHVQGHLDFFDRNGYMAAARTDMEPLLRQASDRFRRYEEEQGLDAVERVIELAQALTWHVTDVRERPAGRPGRGRDGLRDYPLRDLDELLDLRPAAATSPVRDAAAAWRRGLQLPCPDVLWFLGRYAPLEDWERDVVQVVREVGLHLQPQMRTKVMDEGWAVFWGLRLLEELDLPSEVHLIASRLHAHVASPHPLHLNPYWLGWRLWEHLQANGADILTLCAVESDASFLRNWIDADFVRREQLYLWHEVSLAGRGRVLRVQSRGWEAIRDRLAEMVVTQAPYLQVEDVGADRTLWLRCEQGPLQASEAREIVRGVARLWRGAVDLRAGPKGEQRIACKAGEEE